MAGDVIGRGVIEVSADASKLKAGVDDAKRSIKSLGKDIGDSMGTASARASRSIDNYVKRLQTAAATQGKSVRETELYTLSLRGASKAQLEAADSALRMSEGYERGIEIGNRLRVGFIALAAAAASATIAVAAGANALINQVGKYQDLAEKIGDTAVNISSLKTAADVSGVSLETIAAASVKLTTALSKTDDESKLVGDAIRGLGLDFQKFKSMSPVEQLEAVARALEGFADGQEKTAYANALVTKSGAELLGFFKEYAAEGRNAAYVTAEQAKAADDYADAQARLQSQVQQFLQVAAVNAIPILNDIASLMRDIAKEENGTSVATDILKGAIGGAVTIFQTIAVVASDVIFVFKGVGREIGAIAAQLAALARLDFTGFSAISDAVREDGQRARAELDKFQARISAIGKEPFVDDETRRLQARSASGQIAAAPKPRLNISRLNQDKTPKGKKDNSAAQEAKAQLAFDLDEIRKAQEALSNTISNGEKILEAKRSASLVSEADYYSQKRRFIEENDRVQEAAVQKEIARLQAEVLTGKDKIDNDRKILDAQAKLAKLRENAATNLQVLAIKEQDALADIERAYVDATAAAKSYLDMINRAAQAEIAGVGKGQKARDFSSAISSIEEKFEGQRQSLQRDNRNGKFAGREEDFKRELALLNSSQAAEIAIYKAKYAKLDEMQRDWTNGASEALQNYYDESQNIAKQTEELFTNAFKGMEDALVDFVTTGKLDFKSLADSIQKDLVRMAVKESITGPLAKFLKEGIQGEGALGGILGSLGLGGKGTGGGAIAETGAAAATTAAATATTAFTATISASGAAVTAALSALTAAASAAATSLGASGAADIFSSGGGDVLGDFIAGLSGRAIGGPVSAGGMYRINEKGPGEVFEAGGKQYLMAGMSGNVTPISEGKTRGGNTYVSNVNVEGHVNRKTRLQIAGDVTLEQRRAGRYA